MGMKLFDDNVDDVEEVDKIEINPEFAKRYEYNKKREDLQKYEEMKKKGFIESGSESDSESEWEEFDGVYDAKFFDGMLKIRKKDPVLFQKEVRLFESSDEDDEVDEDTKKEKKKKPKYLKDLTAENLIENGPNFEEEKGKSFVEEQKDLRDEVLAALAAAERENGEDDDGGLLKEKKRDVSEEEGNDEEFNGKLDEFYGDDDKLPQDDLFMKRFFKDHLWIDKGNNNVIDDDVGLSEDEKELESQEKYEAEYNNFRHLECKNDRVDGHSRDVKGSVRKEAKPRKEARERRKERKELAEIEMREEAKRLKNLKRKELQEKLNKIREIAGDERDDIPLNEDDLEKDFDPDEHDKKMKDAFGDEYYEAEDVDPEFGNVGIEDDGDLEKPDFGKEDELLGLPKDWDVIKSNDGFLSKRGNKKKKKIIVEDDEDENEDDEHGEEEGKRKRKRKSKLAEALKKELEEELYKYDYEDAIGDLKTRFKYRQVKPDRYKLSAAEILWLDEQELNQYVPLKKLATYREQEWKVPQMRKKMLLEGDLNGQIKQKKRKMDGEGPSKTTDEQTNEDTKLSRSAKRRENMKKKKLPPSRLVAYGQTPSSSKKKSKS